MANQLLSQLQIGEVVYDITLEPSAVKALKPNNVDNLILSDNKINPAYLSDAVLGQLKYGGSILHTSAEVTMSPVLIEDITQELLAKKKKLTVTLSNITLSADSTSVKIKYNSTSTIDFSLEGYFFIMVDPQDTLPAAPNNHWTFANQNFRVGDWLLGSGNAWVKVSNTDCVASVNSGANVTVSNNIGNVSISLNKDVTGLTSVSTDKLVIGGVDVEPLGDTTF